MFSFIHKKYTEKKEKRLNPKLLESARNRNYAETIKYLNAGANVNAKDGEEGVTTLMYAAGKTRRSTNGEWHCPEEGNLNTVKLLLQKKEVDVDAKEIHGMTALMYAAQQGNFEIAKLLIEKNGNSNAQDNYGRSPLYFAAKAARNSCYKSHLEIIKLLLKKGVDPDTKLDVSMDPDTVDGWTALLYAAKNGNAELFEFLLHEGANPYVKTKDGLTALSLLHAHPNRPYRPYNPYDFSIDKERVKIFELIEEIPSEAKSKCLGEFRKIERLLCQGNKNKEQAKKLLSLKEEEFNKLPEQTKNQIFLALPEDILKCKIARFACKNIEDHFEESQIINMANRFFKSPPSQPKDLKEERDFIREIKNPSPTKCI